LDLVWPVFLLLGIEQVSVVPGATAFNPLVFDYYPWSHSLLMACFWALCAAVAARWRGMSNRIAIVIAAVVISHWILDWISHIPDLPLWPGHSPLLGVGLWNSVSATFSVEGAIFIIEIAMYVRSSRAVDRIGSIGFWAFVLVCAALWLSSPWSSPPPSAQALAWFSLGGWLLVAWAGWSDLHRIVFAEVRRSTSPYTRERGRGEN